MGRSLVFALGVAVGAHSALRDRPQSERVAAAALTGGSSLALAALTSWAWKALR